jgi:hypothetical protein
MHRMIKSNARYVAQAPWWPAVLLQLVLGAMAAELSYGQEREAPAADADAAAQEPADKQGLATLVELKLPLGSGGEAPLKQAITRARDRLITEARLRGDGRRPILVLRFVPTGGAEGAGSQFETVLSLARFLESREMADVKTPSWATPTPTSQPTRRSAGRWSRPIVKSPMRSGRFRWR